MTHPTSLSRRAFAGLAATSLVSGALLAGCAGSGAMSESAESQEGDREKVTFVLDYTPNTNHTGIYVALEKGWYAEEGIDLTIVQPPDDGAEVLVGAARAELGMSFQDFLADYFGTDDALPVTAVAAVIQHNTSGIMSRAEDPVPDPKALTGKRYGTWDIAVEKAIVRTLVEQEGGDWNDVTLVPANSTDEVAGLRADQYDAAWCYEAWGYQNAKIQDVPVDYFSLRSVNEVFDYYTPVIIANNDWLKENPSLARSFLSATAKGYEFAVENPEEAANILCEAAPEVDHALAEASQEFLKDQYVAGASQWGIFDAERWNRFYQWMNEEHLTDKAIPLDSGFTNEYLPGKAADDPAPADATDA